MILLLRWKHQHEEQRANFLDGSKQMKVDFSCLMTLVMMKKMKKMKWSCPFSQGSSLPVFIQKRRTVSIVSLKTGTPMLHTSSEF